MATGLILSLKFSGNFVLFFKFGSIVANNPQLLSILAFMSCLPLKQIIGISASYYYLISINYCPNTAATSNLMFEKSCNITQAPVVTIPDINLVVRQVVRLMSPI